MASSAGDEHTGGWIQVAPPGWAWLGSVGKDPLTRCLRTSPKHRPGSRVGIQQRYGGCGIPIKCL